MAAFVRVWKTGKSEKSARISFATPELRWQVLTAKRWELPEGTLRGGASFDPRGSAAGCG